MTKKRNRLSYTLLGEVAMSRLAVFGALLIISALFLGSLAGCSGPAPESESESEQTEQEEEIRGLRIKTDGATDGYVLFAPLLSGTTYLIDVDGQVVHTWESGYAPSGSVYLLENGSILRTGREPGVETFKGGGQGGRIQEITWEGEIVWDFKYASADYLLHHDIERLPNGNILAIAWERKSVEEAKQAGRRPELTPEGGLWPDMVIEIEPVRPDGGKIVWEWHMWDHIVQNTDPNLENYGDPSKKPWRIDINGDGELTEIDPEELEQLKALGYVPDDADAEDLSSDFLHTNAIHYNPELDQIVLSTPRFNELWVIDHSTTTEEAAGSSGGKAGRGGDLLYRWGNPRSYSRGTEKDQKLFAQHDTRWIPSGRPGSGNITVFNNALKSPEGDYSAVLEITPPLLSNGLYEISENDAFGPVEPTWKYTAPDKTSFLSPFISGAERLPNGNTLICSGAQGRFFEVTPTGEIVWEYWTLFSGNIRNPDGSFPHPVGKATYAVFRATTIPPDHPALGDRELLPLDPQPEPVEGPEVPEEEEQ